MAGTNRETQLSRAAERGEEKRVKALLEAGAEASARDSNQQDTPLHLAALHDHEICVRLLLGAGADVHARNWKGISPLHRAVQRQGKSPEKHRRKVQVARMLLDAGADATARDRADNTALHLSTGDGLVVRMLLDAGANAGARHARGSHPDEYS